MAKEYKELVVGLDIGTSKVMVVVAEVLPGGELKLAGWALRPATDSSAASSSTSTPPYKASSRP